MCIRDRLSFFHICAAPAGPLRGTGGPAGPTPSGESPRTESGREHDVRGWSDRPYPPLGRRLSGGEQTRRHKYNR
eukprot:4100315-Pyramimonas_sp.AAC.1